MKKLIYDAVEDINLLLDKSKSDKVLDLLKEIKKFLLDDQSCLLRKEEIIMKMPLLYVLVKRYNKIDERRA